MLYSGNITLTLELYGYRRTLHHTMSSETQKLLHDNSRLHVYKSGQIKPTAVHVHGTR